MGYDTEKKTDKSYSLKFCFKENGCNILQNNDLLKAFFGDDKSTDNIKNCQPPLAKDGKTISLGDIDDIIRDLNDSQKTAVKMAINNNVTLIQGPPGTGKTEVILNILCCLKALYPDNTPTVAVLSNNNEALNNIHEKISENDKYSILSDSIIRLGSNAVRKDSICYHIEKHNIPEDCYCIDENNKFFVSSNFTVKFPFFTSTINSVKKLYQDIEFGKRKQYDYVIVDECSQVSMMLGIIAMSCAKLIVLIGDVEQLSPINNKEAVYPINQKHQDNIGSLYMEQEENSFLEVCNKVFGTLPNTSIMLNTHYRCHPSIIGFNNKYIYNNALKIHQESDNLAIRVVWYEGAYFEKHRTHDKDKLVHTNYRQERILLEEELPLLLERHPGNNFSIGIIAPYKSILESIKKTVTSEDYRRKFTGIKPDDVILESNQHCNDIEDISLPEFSVLSIHKSQGKGYDCVIYLSSDDYYYNSTWPWSQKKRMINVMTSRAKKELCVITSSLWLPEEYQKSHVKHFIPLKQASNTEEIKQN